MNPEEQETEAAHFELWQGELGPVHMGGVVRGFPEQSVPIRPSLWVRVGEMVAFLAVWSVILAVGAAFWVTVGATIWWLVK